MFKSKKITLILILTSFLYLPIFSQVAEGDLRFAFHTTTFNTKDSKFSSKSIGVELGYDFFPCDSRNVGFAFGLGCVYSLDDNLTTDIQELKIDEQLDNARILNIDAGIVLKQRINKFLFREKLLCSFIAPYGKISNYIDNRDLILSGMILAPKLAFSVFYNITPHFYTTCNFSLAYGWGEIHSYIDYTDKDSKSKDLYTTKENATVINTVFSFGFGFLVD